ncbi:hypothetical protein [Neoroseomonas rubea]|uniref:hypothetical protein n=1 Tax=Neoroseomonas rubea TaxID=2748666 RepID=UPI0018DF58F2|nr:hypothetical protein [Roseomonas rubea]
MRQSIVIELMGRFIGVAIADAGSGYGFVAVDERVRDLALRRWPTLGSLRSAARRALQKQPAQADHPRGQWAQETRGELGPSSPDIAA